MKTNWLKNMADSFDKKHNKLFDYDVGKQQRYINSFPQPHDNIERSFFQYKCQMKLFPLYLRIIISIASLPLCLLYMKKKKYDVGKKSKMNAIFLGNGQPSNIIPKSLFNKFSLIELNPKIGVYLSKRDLRYIKNLVKRYPFSWHFIFKNVIKISKYSFIIEKYNPSALIVSNEYSFTSSLLTDYCQVNSIQHINVMHGEKLFYMRDAFFKFDNCYVWDEFYVRLLSALRADERQFVIEIPESMKIKKERICHYDYTYYLGGENRKEMEITASYLNLLRKRGNIISIRPHPRYSKIEDVEICFKNFNIENFNNISIEDSLCNTKAAISLYSTVLNQALSNNIDIVIDDLTTPDHFKKLKRLKYICINKPNKKLSEIIDGDIS